MRWITGSYNGQSCQTKSGHSLLRGLKAIYLYIFLKVLQLLFRFHELLLIKLQNIIKLFVHLNYQIITGQSCWVYTSNEHSSKT